MSILATGCSKASSDALESESQASSSRFEDRILDEAPISARLNVEHYYAPGMCYIVSAASLLNEADKSIDLEKAIVASRPTRFEMTQDTGTGAYIGPAEPVLTMTEAFSNLGYACHVGCLKNPSKLTEVFIDCIPGDRRWFFYDPNSAFSLLKRLVASGFPVEAHIDLSQLALGQTGPDFVVVTGYDENNVYLSISFIRSDNSVAIPIDSFLNAWNTKEDKSFGPCLFTWIDQSDEEPLTDKQMLKLLRRDSHLAIGNEYAYINGLEGGTSQPVTLTSSGVWTRLYAASFLERKGFTQAAARYRDVAEMYRELDANLPRQAYIDKMRNIATMEDEAVGSWDNIWDSSWGD